MLDILVLLVYILLTALVGLITVAVVYARWSYGTLERIKGLPVVVKPAFVGGSDILIYKKIAHEEDKELVKKYGKIFGFYEGSDPHIYVSDPELIRHIFIKDFDHFHNKRIVDAGHDLLNELLDILPYEKWKVVRSLMSPTLTSGKLRSMSVIMTETIQDWIEALKHKIDNNEPFVPKRMFTALTADVIIRCGFGTKINSLHEPDSIFVKHVRNLLPDDVDPNFMLAVAQVFPFLEQLVPFLPPETMEFFVGILKDVMKTRRENNIRINDFVDCLNDMLEKTSSEEFKKLGINETTIMAQALGFFIAGFETTATTLTFITYELSKNLEVQEKLLEELDAYLHRNNGVIDHSTISELTYMNCVIQETLRMYPPLIRIERKCNKPWYYEPLRLQIPEGVVVQVPIHAVHYSEDYYEDPYTFKPERFLPENKAKLNPYAFLSFGSGNHGCIGMRFAKEELPLALANLLKCFKFQANPETKLNFRPGRIFLLSVDPFIVEAIKRY